MSAKEKEPTPKEREIASTIYNEEDETRHSGDALADLLSKAKKKKMVAPSGAKSKAKNFITPDIPLHAIDRKSSQIFYAQSQAKALCMHLDDEKEEDEEDEVGTDKQASKPINIKFKNEDENML